ncbi:hypothetical protein I4U23_003844 [Adineta vaga]|nr:hypothetical protein I4U23_003844 [Adineta vaga]
MDLNLVGKTKDIIVDFHSLPKRGGPTSMTYDMKTKRALLTWLRGDLIEDIYMFYMNPYTSEFQEEILLLKTPIGLVVQDVQAVYDESNRQVLFLIRQNDLQSIKIFVWLIIVEFDTMKIVEKKQINTVIDLSMWMFFQI